MFSLLSLPDLCRAALPNLSLASPRCRGLRFWLFCSAFYALLSTLNMENASKMHTQYYKIGHITLIKYGVYQLNSNNDQVLLELELAIRYKYPKILITYYNKGLYHFQFGHNPDYVDLLKEYPDLTLKSSNKIAVDQLTSPSRPAELAESESPNKDENLPYITVSLLKSIKKFVLFKLSNVGALKIFGNHATINNNSVSNTIMFIEPMLFKNGDILLWLVQKPKLELFNSSVLSIENPNNDLMSNFIIYLLPSGIRCHLFDNLKIINSFTYTPPKNSDHILHLLKLATGLDLSTEENIIWVKLIPNLQHLNNQTSKISKFIHSVDNKRYILWPWKLCLIQFGKFEKSISLRSSQAIPQTTQFEPPQGPFDLISEFMDFSITAKQQLPHNNNIGSAHIPSFSVPSVLSTGGSIDHKMELSMDMNDMIPDLFGGIPNSVGNTFFDEDLKIIDEIHQGDNPSDPLLDNEDNEEMDDLFGDNDSDEQEEIEPEKKSDEIQELFDNDSLLTDQEKADSFFLNNDVKPELPAFDIPKEQMALDQEPYDDPGAPLPVIPTPIILPSASRTAPTSADTDATSAKSVFSPIIFNPLIKSNIDDKYGKGGKFYVDKEHLKDPDTSLQKLRATSVSGYEIRKNFSDEKRGLGIDFDDSNVFFSSEDEKDTTGKSLNDILGEDDEEDEDYDANSVSRHEEDDDNDEESDEDADINSGKDFSPLRLNTQPENTQPEQYGYGQTVGSVQPGSVQPGSVQPQVLEIPASIKNNNAHLFTGTTSFTTPTGYIPPSSRMGNNVPRFDSPFAIHDSPIDDKAKFSSPLVIENDDFKRQMALTVPQSTGNGGLNTGETPSLQDTTAPADTTADATADGPTSGGNVIQTSPVSESSNCLPLILRGINVTTIPDEFLLNNIPGAIKMSASASDFNMDVDQDDENFELSKKNEMSVKAENLNEFLSFLGPNLVYDFSLNDCEDKLTSNLPEDYKTLEVNHLFASTDLISSNFEQLLTMAFPLCYKVKLDELLADLNEENTPDETNNNEVDNQLSFLDDITNDEILNPKSKLKKLDLIEWDSIYVDNMKNNENFREYMDVLQDINDSSILDSTNTVIPLSENKVKVLKEKDIINLNSISLRFWKYLNFDPMGGKKNFQILLVSETLNNSVTNNYSQDFLESLIYNYNECNFGDISKISLQSSRPDIESINNGSILIHKNDNNYNHVYKQANKKLNTLVELIKSDLIDKTNHFEFNRPILLMFLNFNKNFNSLTEISKICRNFQLALKRHQLPLVQVFSKILPAEFAIKEVGDQRCLKYLSNYKLTKLSMNLYNQCPDTHSIKRFGLPNSVEYSQDLFTNVVNEPISKINFKFFNSNGPNKDYYSNDDAFLHLAYERSIDRNWVTASWSDPLGIVTYTKSWCNSTSLLKSSGNNTSANRNDGTDISKSVFDLQSICDQIMDISNSLFKKLNEEIIKRTSGLGGKKFLVLTRVNNIIPDEELVHWKRLSAKSKDISLIVLSVNNLPKPLFEDIASEDLILDLDSKDSKPIKLENNDQDFFKGFNDVSPNNLLTSPSNNFNFSMNTSGNFLSPDASGQLSTTPLSGGTSNPLKGDVNDIGVKDAILSDPTESITALIPKTSVPSFNCPTRPGMKTGYIAKKFGSKYYVFEVSLLSCSNFWNLTSLMKLLLQHYKKLITLNDILGTTDIDVVDQCQKAMVSRLVPWHIAAVSKSLNYLVHVEVEE